MFSCCFHPFTISRDETLLSLMEDRGFYLFDMFCGKNVIPDYAFVRKGSRPYSRVGWSESEWRQRRTICDRKPVYPTSHDAFPAAIQWPRKFNFDKLLYATLSSGGGDKEVEKP